MIEVLLVVGSFLAVGAWIGFGTHSEAMLKRRVVGFKDGTYKPAESQLVRMKLENIQNYNLPRAFTDITKFTCAACNCHKLDLEHQSFKIINRIKESVRDDVLKIMRSIKVLDSGFDKWDFYSYIQYPTDSTNLQFQYLRGTCHGCKKYIDDFHISGGKQAPEPVAPTHGDDVA